MDDMILQVLDAFEQVADDPGVVGYDDPQGILDRTHGSDGVHGRADAADALGERPRVPRVAALQHEFHAPEAGAGAPGIGYLAVIDLHFDAQMPFDASDRVDGDPLRSRRRGHL